MTSYPNVLQQIAQEIHGKIKSTEQSIRDLNLRMERNRQRNLYFCVWEDKLSLIAEEDVPGDLSWEDYEQVVLSECRRDLQQSAVDIEKMEQELAGLETQLRAWQFAYSLVATYEEELPNSTD